MKYVGTRQLWTLALLGAGLCAAIPARAQVPGEYVGIDSDGFSMRLAVYQNPKGDFFLTFVQAAAYFYCDGRLLLTEGQKSSHGAAILMQAPIKDGNATFAGQSNNLSALTGTVAFDGEKVSGSLVAYASLFTGTQSPPTDAQAKSCKSRHLRFKAVLFNPLS